MCQPASESKMRYCYAEMMLDDLVRIQEESVIVLETLCDDPGMGKKFVIEI